MAILFHPAALRRFTWIPKYVFKVPPVIDPNNAIKDHKDFTYLDTPLSRPKPVKPLPRQPQVVRRPLTS